MPNQLATLTATEIAIAARAITMLESWNWANGEPLAALTLASTELFGEVRHAELANIGKSERMYAPRGAACNTVEARLALLRAVVRFQAVRS